ncbi:GNAT family N-acetyltransferase [Paenibacillus monticola]|uniref:GNAT family N-acetyltransferase n=1 Tax=Paenibacillus monticola TaxID=2666075 RepID=A0A7X2H2Y9_9BACL|nr:GNAT family N-acetyltransferase [Paenibacillus monticola]
MAETDSVVVGYIIGTVHESDEVYVHPDHRSDNSGHLMVDKLLQTAERKSINRSIVYSASKQWQKIIGLRKAWF